MEQYYNIHTHKSSGNHIYIELNQCDEDGTELAKAGLHSIRNYTSMNYNSIDDDGVITLTASTGDSLGFTLTYINVVQINGQNHNAVNTHELYNLLKDIIKQ